MLKRRFIPVLFLQNGWIVRSESFAIHQVIGSPFPHVERMMEWDVDELIVLDISRGEDAGFAHGRLDHIDRGGSQSLREFVEQIASVARIPLTFGGRIRSLEDIAERIRWGADKVCLNTMILNDTSTVRDAAKIFGSQALVASIDYRIVDGTAVAFGDHGGACTGILVSDLAKRAQDSLVGEIFLNSIDRDGRATGYDLDTIDQVVGAVDLPVIVCGGAGHQSHFLKCFQETEAAAVAAGNIFHFTENAYPRAKAYLKRRGCLVR